MYECAALHAAPPDLDTDDYPLLGLHDVKVTQYRRGEPERVVDLFDVIQSGPFRVRGILEPVPPRYRKVLKRSFAPGTPLLISSVHTYSMEHVLVRGEGGRREARIWVLGKAAWYEINPGIEYLSCYKAMVEKTSIWMFLGQNVERYTARPSRKFPRLEMADVYKNYCEYDTTCRTTRAAAKLFDKCTRFLVFKMAGEEEIKKWRGSTVWDYYKENHRDVLDEALDHYGHSKKEIKVRKSVVETDKEEGLLTPEYTDDDGRSDENESTADAMEAENGEGDADEELDEDMNTGDATEAGEEPDENTSTRDVTEAEDSGRNEDEEENENTSTGGDDGGRNEDKALDENTGIGDEKDDTDLEEEDGEKNEDEESDENMSIGDVVEVGDRENETDDDDEAEDEEEDEDMDDETDTDTDDDQESDQHTPAPHDPGKTTSSKGCSILRPRRSEIPVVPDTHQVNSATTSPLGFHGTRIKRGAGTTETAVASPPPASKKQIIEQPKKPYFSRKSEGFWRCTLDEPRCNHVIPNAKTRDGRNEVEKHYKSHGKVMRDALITLDEEEGKGGYQLGHLFGKLKDMQRKWIDGKPTPLKGLGE